MSFVGYVVFLFGLCYRLGWILVLCVLVLYCFGWLILVVRYLGRSWYCWGYGYRSVGRCGWWWFLYIGLVCGWIVLVGCCCCWWWSCVCVCFVLCLLRLVFFVGFVCGVWWLWWLCLGWLGLVCCFVWWYWSCWLGLGWYRLGLVDGGGRKWRKMIDLIGGGNWNGRVWNVLRRCLCGLCELGGKKGGNCVSGYYFLNCYDFVVLKGMEGIKVYLV